jgi:hypothetical protein
MSLSARERKPALRFSWRSDRIKYKVQVKREKYPVSMEAAEYAGLK